METIRQGTTPAWLLTIRDGKGREQVVTDDWTVWVAVATSKSATPVITKSTGGNGLAIATGKVALPLSSADTAQLADGVTYYVFARWKDPEGIVEERDPVLTLRGEATPLAAQS